METAEEFGIVVIPIDSINDKDRIRVDLGDIDGLCDSIQKYGLIQPIVVERDSLILVAGGRRITALKRIGYKKLTHAVHFIWRDEDTPLRRKATELEENLRRKALDWQEELAAKRALLDTMQEIHGVASVGAHTVRDNNTGFGVIKLAAMLGESASTTSRDLAVADAVAAMPLLKKLDTKGAAFQKMRMLGTVVKMAVAAHAKKVEDSKPNVDGTPNVKPTSWTLYEGDFRDHIHKIQDGTVDLIHTDLPYGSSVEKMSAHAGALGFSDGRETIISLLPAIAKESYRILRNDRYAVFWFGFNNYPELVAALSGASYMVIPVPLIWIKNTKSGENPNTRYSNSYEAALVVCKGSPLLMRPGAGNVKTFPTVLPSEKLHLAEKPIDLILDIYRDLVPQNGLIVDLMAGSGSSGVAALRHNSKVILFEKEPIHCRIIKDRLTSGKDTK